MSFIQSLRLAGLLSFPPGMEPFELEPLNVLIGPNGSGKSNLIEAFGLLRALPSDLEVPLRAGGGVSEWLWKGGPPSHLHQVQIALTTGMLPVGNTIVLSRLRYIIELISLEDRLHVSNETLLNLDDNPSDNEKNFYYENLFHNHIFIKELGTQKNNKYTLRSRELDPSEIMHNQSILSQFQDPKKYFHLSWLGNNFSRIQTFREWSFSRTANFRCPQPADLPDDRLLSDGSNLAVIVNQVENRGDWQRFNELLQRFFPRFERLSVSMIGGTVQLLLHEKGLSSPVPAIRISDGTLRFVAMLAVLLSPNPPPLVCIEEPELGLHPDAVALMADVLVEASVRMQLVVTTHSDALVSALTNRPSSIVACERHGDGTVLRRMDPARLSDLLEDYTLGHLWRQGELGANP